MRQSSKARRSRSCAALHGEIGVTIELHYYPVHTIPDPLDVVWCRFPLEELPHLPAPSPHPTLVRAVELFQGHTKARIEVTFGTSKNVHENSLDLIVANLEEMNFAGLFQNTTFKLDKTRKLPWAEEFFVAPEGKKSPIIGHLGPASIAQLEAIKVLRRKPRRR